MADKRRKYTHILHLRAASIALGVGIAVLTLLAARSAQAQTFNTLFTFNGSDGAEPVASLIQGTDGYLYGTTDAGGANGYGTVFKISSTGELTTLYDFCSVSGCADGANPSAWLIQATDGNFYGTTYFGGTNNNSSVCIGSSFGCGTIFKLTPKGTLTTLYSFCSQSSCTDGAQPNAGLVQATDGNFYGTTRFGGANLLGALFKTTPSGTFTALHSFCPPSDCTDGAWPMAGLIQASNGYLYGTTTGGGPSAGGTIFKTTLSGALTTVYGFCRLQGCTDGKGPWTPVQARDGYLYGTTFSGGANGGGTVFKSSAGGTLTTLYSFCPQSGCSDGQYPAAGLIQATDGNLYGTTEMGGASSAGTIFTITTGGTLTRLHTFCTQSCADGETPLAALVQDTNGVFYGTAVSGTIFSLSVGLSPFVETEPTWGEVGRSIKILGTQLNGTTSVTFNGTPAVFTVLSNSSIGARVPEGATTGTVQVVTPSGTLSSNVPFRVRQH